MKFRSREQYLTEQSKKFNRCINSWERGIQEKDKYFIHSSRVTTEMDHDLFEWGNNTTSYVPKEGEKIVDVCLVDVSIFEQTAWTVYKNWPDDE